MSPFTELDFGLTAVAGQFHQDWMYDGTPVDILAGLLRTEDPEEVGALRDDARLALTGPSADQVATLFVAATTNFNFGPADPGATSGPVWLETVIGACDRWFAEHSSVPGQRHPPELVDEVSALIVEILEDQRRRSEDPPVEEVTAALLACARNCSADLAFRFLMRIIIQQGVVTLTTAQFDRL